MSNNDILFTQLAKRNEKSEKYKIHNFEQWTRKVKASNTAKPNECFHRVPYDSSQNVAKKNWKTKSNGESEERRERKENVQQLSQDTNTCTEIH